MPVPAGAFATVRAIAALVIGHAANDAAQAGVGASATVARAPLVCAHRGASARHPENTAAAFVAAVEMGADMLEADVRRVRGRLVLAHDPCPPNTRPSSLLGLDELAHLAGARVRLDVELKEPGYESAVLAALEPRPPGLLVTSFLPQVLRTLRALDPAVETGLIVGRGDRAGDPIARAERCGARTLVAHASLADRRLRRRARAEGLELAIWTVNRPAQLAALARAPEVSCIITDVPDAACAACALRAA